MKYQDYHPLLKRQLKRQMQKSGGRLNLREFLELVNQRYIDADKTQKRLEHSIKVSSEELSELYLRAKEQKEKAEQANISKSQFLANMSHEIRTPLNGVLGFTSLLASTKLSDTQKEYLNIIQSSGKSLLFLLNDILDLSKIESGKIELESVRFNLPEIISTCIDIFRGQLLDHNVEMNAYIHPSLCRHYIGDPERLTQILSNFISNALKFTKRGSVSVEVIPATISQNDTDIIQFKVIDTGIGISEDKLEIIFESFAQEDLSTTREYGGTGLGLSISKQLAGLMGGEILLESERGKGSTFTLEIPLERSELIKNSVFDKSNIDIIKNKTILIVDDMEVNRKYFEAQLSDFEMKCISATSCDEAINVLESGVDVDIVLTDHLMPKKDGLELIAEIRSRKHMANMPIILSSSSGLANLRTKNTGFNALVAKPVMPQKLLSEIKKLLAAKPQALKTYNLPIKPDRSNLRILVAEDNFVNQQLIRQSLESHFFVVDIVANGQEAVRAIKTLHYDLVLMDLQMPEMNGFEASKKIRALNIENSKIPIIALTASMGEDIRQKCFDSGMNDFLTKPVSLDVLHDMILKWLDKDDAGQVVNQHSRQPV